MARASSASSSKLPALHFIRRQAARILRILLKGNAEHRAVASVKSLVFKPSVISKKATFALICQTLKYLSVIKEVLESANLLEGKYKAQRELFYVITHDLLTQQEILPSGEAEVLLLSRKNALRAALVRLLVKKNVTDIDGLLPANQLSPVRNVPRYVRVNTLKISVDEALEKLKEFDTKRDDLLPDLLILPAGTDLHDHPLVLQGSLFLQGKASCMPAHALQPNPDWEVLDACAAPGNKTVQLAALMSGKGRITACELNKARLKILRETVKRSGASNVEVLHQDFLKIDTASPKFSNVRGILLDPSCSGSGTAVQRLDHLLPTATDNHEAETKRIGRLVGFQKAALLHALSFPSVERVVYSTCSLNQSENEEVIKSALEHARSLNFDLSTPLATWPHRGLPVFDGAHHLLRTDPARDKMDGFFIAVFSRRSHSLQLGSTKDEFATEPRQKRKSLEDKTEGNDCNSKKKRKTKKRRNQSST